MLSEKQIAANMAGIRCCFDPFLRFGSAPGEAMAADSGVRLQIGGSDQWGNIVAGIELARRTDAVSLFALTTPLITTASDIRTTFARHGGALEARVGEPAEARLDWRPATTVPLDEGQAAGGMTLLDALEASDDVQNMYANYEIPEPVMAALSA